MMGGAQGDEIVESVGFGSGDEGFEGNLMMHVVLASALGRAADLTAESVTGPRGEAQALPIWAVVVGIVGPRPAEAQRLDRRLRKREPVTGSLEFGGRQVERFFAEVLLREPAQLLEADHLRGDLDFAPAFFAARPPLSLPPSRLGGMGGDGGGWRGEGGEVGNRQNLNLSLALRLGVVVERDGGERGDVLFEIQLVHVILLALRSEERRVGKECRS